MLLATAQEQIAPAQASSDAPQPPKAPEDAVGVKPPEDNALGGKAVADAKFPDADGKKDDSASKEDSASKDAQAAPTEPAKAEDVVADTTPVGTAAGGIEQQEIAPKEDVPSVTGATSGDAPAQPPPSDLPAAPAEATVNEPSAAEEKPAAAETNGAQKDADVGEQPPVPAPEEAVGAPVSTGEKRKAEEEPVPTNGDAKKAKVDDANGAATNSKPEAKKPGRPSKKEKKPVEKAKEAVGRTLRKTRSQGPIDQ